MAGRPLGPDDPVRVGAYRIESKIGEGGMGAVYLGRADGDGRRVAVKVVRPELAGDPAFLARFHDEAVNAERVASFCTAQVHEHGRDLGLAYLVTEYIEGPSLEQHMRQRGPLSPGMLHGVAVGVAAALVAIHSAGLVHRDLKPSNVLLSLTGPRVIDFGIARALDVAVSHTRTGQVVGTPGYIAPEQVSGQQMTPAVDVFAWGCLVAYAASGQNPFGSGSFEIMIARSLHAEPDLSALTTEPLAGLVRRALAKDPKSRPSAQDLLLGLVGGASEAAVSTTLNQAWDEPLPQPLPQPPPRPLPEAAPAPFPQRPSDDVRSVPTPTADAATHPPTDVARNERTHPPTETAKGFAQEQPPPNRANTVPVPGPDRPTPVYGPGNGPVPRTHPGERPTRTATKRRTAPILVALAVAAVMAAGGGTAYLLSKSGHDKSSGSSKSASAAAAFPSETLLARQDTAPGWPQKCHARIVRYSANIGGAPAAVTSGSCDMLPAYAPGLRKFAFTRRTGSGNQLWTADADGSNAAKLVDKIGGGRTAWSPDGRQIAYFAKDDAGVNQLHVVTVADGKTTQLTTDDAVKDDPSWGRSGKLAYFSAASGQNQIYLLDPQHPDQPGVRLTKDDVFAKDPSWSPDGARIVFTHGAYPHGEIWIMQADGSGAHRLVTSSEHAMDPVWSRDGSWVAYTRGPYATPVVWAVRADGTGDRRVSPQGTSLAHPGW
ncbi:protein kinase domain-containing protein [Actinomadura oligospora]|uniref:protein kinase domain-containing protein n=1 Tax=Actinomadura oligospora TaxID=111804 RepID=UPI000684545B|nr:protein kinase [Actinomadura oligospora]